MLVIRTPLLLKQSSSSLSSELLGKEPMKISQSLRFLIASRRSLSSTYSLSALLTGWSFSSSSISIESTTITSQPRRVCLTFYLHYQISLSIWGLYFSGTSKTAEFLLCFLIPLTSSASSSDVFLLKKLKMKPGAWYSTGHFNMYVIQPSMAQRIDLCDIFFVLPEMKANALERDLTAPSSLIISSAISLKQGKTSSLTYFKLMTISLALDLTMSVG